MHEITGTERRRRVGTGGAVPGGRRHEDPDATAHPPSNPAARVARYRLLVEASADVVSRHNRAGRFLDVSPSAATVLGRSPAALLDCSWRDLIHPEDVLRFDDWWRTVHGGTPGNLGFRIVRPDGGIVWVEAAACAGILLEHGVFEVQAVTRDISAHIARVEAVARRCRDLEQRAARLDRSNHELSRFATDAAHDLRAPLQVISGFAQLLARREGGRLDETSQRFVASVLAAVGDMVELLDAALEQGRPQTERSRAGPIDSAAVVRRVIDRLRTEIDATGTTVEVGNLPVVHADRAQLGRLFQNLLCNAMKAGTRGRPVHVIVAAERSEGGWTLSVTDDGVGVRPEDRERIFGLFERSRYAPDAGGNGVGLAICRSVVERQGGRIWVEDTPSGGARFVFFLPDPAHD